MQRIIIFGATSAIAAEVGRIYASRQSRLFLVGRNRDKLAAVAADLEARGAAAVFTAVSDLAEVAGHAQLFSEAHAKLEGVDVVLIAHGSLPDQSRCQQDFKIAEREIVINFLSPLSLLEVAARYFEQRGHGSVAVISSVAGDRGRQSNYVYGAAKGALSIAVAGVRNRLASRGVHVLTIKPGFVDTPMTAHLKKGPLFASPKQVAGGIVRAIDGRKEVVYLPWFWSPIMLVIKHIPEAIFKRMRL